MRHSSIREAAARGSISAEKVLADAAGDMIHKMQVATKALKTKVEKFLKSTDMMKQFDVARAVSDGKKLEKSCQNLLLKAIPEYYAKLEKLDTWRPDSDPKVAQANIERAKIAAQAMDKARTETLKVGGEILAVQSSLSRFVKWANWPN